MDGTLIAKKYGLMNGGGGGGTSNYNELTNKPRVNSVELSGNKSLDDLGIQMELTAGENISISESGVISASGGTGNDVFSVEIVTTSTGADDASIRVVQKVNGTVVSNHEYLYSDLITPITIHDFMTIEYGQSGYVYTLLRSSFTHNAQYTCNWPYSESVSYVEGCFYNVPTVTKKTSRSKA